MPLWSKVREELDRAGRVAQQAIDEGRVRLDAFRARQLADKAAQALGYAVFNARREGREPDPNMITRLSDALAARDAEAKRLEEQLASAATKRKGSAADQSASPPPSADAPPVSTPPADVPPMA
jgi:hypothetical protein